MRGRKPIFATMVSSTYTFLRDSLFKAVLEPQTPAVRRAKRIKKKKKEK